MPQLKMTSRWALSYFSFAFEFSDRPEKGARRDGRTEGELFWPTLYLFGFNFIHLATIELKFYSLFQRLRNENRLLKKQNELLEAESTELAHRLVRGQVSRAEEEETAFAIESELMALRKTHVELSHQLETANEEIRGLSLRLQENVSASIDFDMQTVAVRNALWSINVC